MTEGSETQLQQVPPAPAVEARAGAFLLEKLHALDGRLGAAAPRVLASNEDRDAVHDLRVALRRTRTVLEVGRSVLGRFQAEEVRRALRDVQRMTGELRDEEVLLDLLGSLGLGDPDVNAWLEARRARERRLRRALIRAVQSGRLDSGRRLLAGLLAFPIKPSRDRRLSKLARRAVDKARRNVLRLRVANADDPEALHQLRIAYKKLRYVVETFSDALPEDLAGLAKPAARFQSRLGDLHDADVAIAVVRRARAIPDAARGQLLSALDRLRGERLGSYAREIGLVNIGPALPAKAVPRSSEGKPVSGRVAAPDSTKTAPAGAPSPSRRPLREPRNRRAG